MGRPNRGVGVGGFKKPGNTGGKSQYSAGGSTKKSVNTGSKKK